MLVLHICLKPETLKKDFDSNKIETVAKTQRFTFLVTSICINCAPWAQCGLAAPDPAASAAGGGLNAEEQQPVWHAAVALQCATVWQSAAAVEEEEAPRRFLTHQILPCGLP